MVRLVPVLNSLEQAEAWFECAGKLARAPLAVFQIESRMNWLGLMRDEAIVFASKYLRLAVFDLRIAMSHFACVDT